MSASELPEFTDVYREAKRILRRRSRRRAPIESERMQNRVDDKRRGDELAAFGRKRCAAPWAARHVDGEDPREEFGPRHPLDVGGARNGDVVPSSNAASRQSCAATC